MIRSTFYLIVFLVLVGALGCSTLKTNPIFVDIDRVDTTSEFIAAEVIYRDFFTGEGWFTLSKECISVTALQEAAYAGDYGLKIKWDAVKQGCPWLGVGFGWDSWQSKDLSEIKYTGAVSMWARYIGEDAGILPWAVGLEDYENRQAWLGMSKESTIGGRVTGEWTQIILPLSEFNWEEQGADPSNIKQIILNLYSAGEVHIDEIRLIPYHGGFRKRLYIPDWEKSEFTVDGRTDEEFWKKDQAKIDSSHIHLALQDNYVCFALKIPIDNTWDASSSAQFDLIFATDPDISARRIRTRSTDRWVQLIMDDQPKLVDGFTGNSLPFEAVEMRKDKSNLVLECRISSETLNLPMLKLNGLYGLDMSLRLPSSKKPFSRWNHLTDSPQFNNPSLWGEMMLENPTEDKPQNP
jgi:hypothetical protein